MITNYTYLDYAATTDMLPEVIDTMLPYMKNQFGNPSSHYSLGMYSKHAINNARRLLAEIIHCEPEEIYFTSGGSESNSWAIKGLKNKYHVRPMHIVSSSIEHHSILESLKTRWNESEDIEYTLVNPGRNGQINDEDIANSFKLNTNLCSVMAVNNETGIIQPIQRIAFKCKDNGIFMHVDAVQAFGYLQLDVEKLGIDLMSVSAHKIHGPKGVGFLYISNECKRQMIPLVNGGQQEQGLRGSTENVAGIVGFAKAAEIAYSNINKNREIIKDVNQYLIVSLCTISGITFNGDYHLSDLRHVNVQIDGIKSEELMGMLDAVNIYVSAGSACNSDSNQPSHVLKAMGLTDEEANSSIRISINEQTTRKDIDTFIVYLKQFIEMLRERDK